MVTYKLSINKITGSTEFTATPSKPTVSKDGENSALPAGYVTIGKNPAALVNGILTIGLSSTMGGFPAIWREGEEQTLKINGFISSVSSFGALP